jgi:hypothetical protein
MNLAELKVKKAELDKQIEANAKEAIVNEFLAFFALHPEISAIRWLQYTPYFNDGDVCEFGVYDFTFQLTDEHFISEKEYKVLDCRSGYDNRKGDGFLYRAPKGYDWSKEIKKIFDSSTEILFKFAFGDHARVTVTRSGFEIEEYDHD